MSIVLGIDAGISSTKIIGIENGKRIMEPLSVQGSVDVSSIYGALGCYLADNKATLDDIEHIMLTGICTLGVNLSLFDCPTSYVDEFKANGLGARFESGLDRFIVVSMGTGTSLVRVDGDEITHIGGIGMGGGTLLGLSQMLLHTNNINNVNYWSTFGSSNLCNMRIGDICEEEIEGLPENATASLFVNTPNNNASRDDIAAGLIHMVLETIGSCAVLSQTNGGFKDFVLIGKLTELFLCQEIFPELERLYGVHFHIPKYAPFCTALGAVLSYRYENE